MVNVCGSRYREARAETLSCSVGKPGEMNDHEVLREVRRFGLLCRSDVWPKFELAAHHSLIIPATPKPLSAENPQI